jgi:hypothetical protein
MNESVVVTNTSVVILIHFLYERISPSDLGVIFTHELRLGIGRAS